MTEKSMTSASYQEAALRTMADQNVIRERNYKGVDKKGNPHFGGLTDSVKLTQLDNAARGMAGDVGEVNTCVQQALEYGKPLDLVNLLEELGDVQWRIIQACDAVGFTLEQVMRANIAKLAKRYPDKYTDHLADEVNRDREAERAAVAADPRLVYVVAIGSDGLCDCDCGKACPLGKMGMETRCTKEELIAQGIRIVEQPKEVSTGPLYTIGSAEFDVKPVISGPSNEGGVITEQTGQGWAEPKEWGSHPQHKQEVERIGKELASDVEIPVRFCEECHVTLKRNEKTHCPHCADKVEATRMCSKCGMPIHRNQPTDVCSSCYKPN